MSDEPEVKLIFEPIKFTHEIFMPSDDLLLLSSDHEAWVKYNSGELTLEEALRLAQSRKEGAE